MFVFYAGMAIGGIIGYITASVSKDESILNQNQAEAAVSLCLRRHLSPDEYHVMNNVTLRIANTTTQIDHIVVSRYGIFIIETKRYKGTILGTVSQKKWTQFLFRKSFFFNNPIMQNEWHVKAVKEIFKLDPSVFHSVVVFCGRNKFMADIPVNVVKFEELIPYIKRFDKELLSYRSLVYCVGRIETMRLQRSRETDEYHLNNLAKTMENKTKDFSQ